MAIDINTSKVVFAAEQIEGYNKKIRSGMTELEKSIRELERSWDGQASETAVGRFKQINCTFSEPRYSVVDNLSRFMKQQVGISYDTVETSVATAASAFK